MVTWEIVPLKTNVNLDFASVEFGFLGVTISHVTLSCSQYLYNTVLGYYRRYMAEIMPIISYNQLI